LGKLPGQPESPPKEHINVVTTRVGGLHKTPHILRLQEKNRESRPYQRWKKRRIVSHNW